MTTATKKQHLLKSIGHISYTELVELVDENIQAKQNDRFEVIETRFEKKLSQETNRLEMKILEFKNDLKDQFNARFDQINAQTNSKFDSVNSKFDQVNNKFDQIHAKLDTNLKWNISMWLTQTIAIIATLKAIVR